MKRLILLSAALLLAALAAPNGWAKDGKDVYTDKCAGCHGPDGTGSTARGKKLKVKPVKEIAGKLKAEAMVKIVEEGKGLDMPAYAKELSKEQIQAVVEHYRGLAK
ncbi:MAG: cytochrome c [Acidobacteriota bacterium]